MCHTNLSLIGMEQIELTLNKKIKDSAYRRSFNFTPAVRILTLGVHLRWKYNKVCTTKSFSSINS